MAELPAAVMPTGSNAMSPTTPTMTRCSVAESPIATSTVSPTGDLPGHCSLASVRLTIAVLRPVASSPLSNVRPSISGGPIGVGDSERTTSQAVGRSSGCRVLDAFGGKRRGARFLHDAGRVDSRCRAQLREQPVIERRLLLDRCVAILGQLDAHHVQVRGVHAPVEARGAPRDQRHGAADEHHGRDQRDLNGHERARDAARLEPTSRHERRP